MAVAKSLLKIQARNLRREKGLSIKSIAQRIGVSKSTVSLWCSDIQLSDRQIYKFILRARAKSIVGALKGAKVQKDRRLKLIEEFNRRGELRFTHLNEGEFFVAGLALYWAEGYKKGKKITFTNSDPLMIKFMINWLHIFFRISAEEFRFRVDINEVHQNRDMVVKRYWSEALGMPLSRFNRTSFKKVANKKVYENFNEHYGTLRFEIAKPVRVLYPLLGYIHGLALNQDYRDLAA